MVVSSSWRALALGLALGGLLLAGVTVAPPGEAQVTSGTQTSCSSFDVGFVFDKNNIPIQEHSNVQAGIQSILDLLGAMDQSALWSAPDSGSDKTSLDSDHEATEDAALAAPSVTGSGTLRTAIEAATAELDASFSTRSHQVLVIISDGNWGPAADVTDAWKDNQYKRVFAIAVGESPSPQMEDFASGSRAPYYHEAPDGAAITAALQEVAAELEACGVSALKLRRDIGPCWDEPITARLSWRASSMVEITAIDVYWDVGGEGGADLGLPPETTALEHTFQDWGLKSARVELWEGSRFAYGDDFDFSVPRCPIEPPTVAFTCAVTETDNLVAFEATATKKAGEIVSYEWDLGDGTTGPDAPTFDHQYAASDMYNVRLTVIDSDGIRVTVPKDCTTRTNQAPTVDFIDNIVVEEGEAVEVLVTGSDPDPWDEPIFCIEVPPGMNGPTVSNGHLFWQTREGHRNTYGPFTACAFDGLERDTTTFFITVLPKDTRKPNDGDGDGITDEADNCPSVPNPAQSDGDNNGFGDACQVRAPDTEDPPQETEPEGGTDARDGDFDRTPDALDNCEFVANGDQSDMDGDGDGDACDDEQDGDGIVEATSGGTVFPDNCPYVPNSLQQDGDADGYGDLCDNCPSLPNRDQFDTDGDGLGDACDITGTAGTGFGGERSGKGPNGLDDAPVLSQKGMPGPVLGLIAMLGAAVIVGGLAWFVAARSR